MNFTLFGYPKTGKTSLFNILTGSKAEISAFEGRREANERMCPLPDARLDRLAALHPDKRKIPAAIDVVDLAGITFGEVKSGAALAALRKADALIHVVRAFADEALPHPRNRIDPADDIRAMEEELVLADFISVETRLEKLDKDLKKMKSPDGERERDLLLKLKVHLESGAPLRTFAFQESDDRIARTFAFLSRKPLAHLVNVGEAAAGRLGEIESGLTAGPRAAVLAFCGKIEGEILEVEDEEERKVFRAAYGLEGLTAPRFFPLILDLLDQIIFYTIGKDEVRAWTVRRDSPAVKAAGAIHTDIEKGFIRAEVAPWTDIAAAGTWARAREQGLIRLEGRDDVVHDGDVVFFRFAT